MKRNESAQKKSSLRTLIIFCSVVLLLVLGSLFFKLFNEIKGSQFEGKGRFTIAFIYNKDLDLVSIEPESSGIYHLEVRANLPVEESIRQIGVFTDSTLYLNKKFDVKKSISSYMIDELMHKHSKTKLSAYDLIRIALASKGRTLEYSSSKQLKLPLDKVLIDDATKELFLDNKLNAENKTISIINGTNVQGLGGRLERAVRGMGGNVVNVSNSEKILTNSEISYYEDSSYTVERLSKILNMNTKKLNGQGLSDIIIKIGEDRKNTISY